MKPLIKWPGGKSREINKISKLIPQFDRYFEPFFGGGAVGFKLEPEIAYVNDIDSQLINFYWSVKNEELDFVTDVSLIQQDWQLLDNLVEPLLKDFLDIYHSTVDGLTENGNVKTQMLELLDENHTNVKNVIGQFKYANSEDFIFYLNKFLKSKAERIRKLQIKHETIFDDELMQDHLHTGLKSAYYTYIRDEHFNEDPKDAAAFYFIREFCYGSMFRYNNDGKFNIPYGGINYNSKDFKSKIEKLFADKTKRVLQYFEFHNLDFEEFFNQFKFTDADFIFLDPPYDTDFSDYGMYQFQEEEQTRLANVLSTCDANWMLVIKQSDLISDLYGEMQDNNADINILSYDKLYTYNVRGRNDRDASHLMITNYTVDQTLSKDQKQIKEFF